MEVGGTFTCETSQSVDAANTYGRRRGMPQHLGGFLKPVVQQRPEGCFGLAVRCLSLPLRNTAAPDCKWKPDGCRDDKAKVANGCAARFFAR